MCSLHKQTLHMWIKWSYLVVTVGITDCVTGLEVPKNEKNFFNAVGE